MTSPDPILTLLNPGSHGKSHNGGDSTIVPTLPGQGEVIWEKPHDPRALYLPLLHGKLKRGFIVQDKSDPATKANKHGRPLGLHFLYNPTEVDVSYSINTAIFPSASSPGSDIPLIGVPGAASVSWNLILDRTYDVQDPSDKGILEDVHQFERMMAYSPDEPFIQPVSMFVVFGNTRLKYYGFIQSFQVVYTNWTQELIPYRGGISGITLQVLPIGSGKKAKAHIYETVGPKGGVIPTGGGGGGGKGKKGGDGTGKSQGGKKKQVKPSDLVSVQAQNIGSGVAVYSDSAGKHKVGVLGSDYFPPSTPDRVQLTFTNNVVINVKVTHTFYIPKS